MDVAGNKQIDENTKIMLKWEAIKRISQHKLVQPTVHRYLNDHVKSAFKRIDPEDWVTAMMLPVEQFTGSSKQNVWRKSMG